MWYQANEQGDVLVDGQLVGTNLDSREHGYVFTDLQGTTQVIGQRIVRLSGSAAGARPGISDLQQARGERFARDLELADQIGAERRRLRIEPKIVARLMRETDDLAAVLAALPGLSMASTSRGYWARRRADEMAPAEPEPSGDRD